MLRAIGQRGTLGIILRSYDPSHINCGTVTQRYTENDNCDQLLQTIPADVAPPRNWGPRNHRGVDKILPYSWNLDCKCRSYSAASALLNYGCASLRLIVHLSKSACGNEYLAYVCRLSIWGAYGDQNVNDDMTFYDMWTGKYLDSCIVIPSPPAVLKKADVRSL